MVEVAAAARYFAYGSNLAMARLVGRVPSALPLGPARLDGHRLRLDKRGSDGSGKANLRPDPGAHVWGALYAIDPDHWPALDACEPGYERIAVEVSASGRRLRAQTYCSLRLTREPVAFEWYRALMVEGAREHGLPAPYVAWLASLPVRPDADEDSGRR